MSQFSIRDLPFDGVKLIERKQIFDNRGSFSRMFCLTDLEDAGWLSPINQINHSYTRMTGTVRGLHFQFKPFSEMKMVSCLKGMIWDVVVDIRKQSSTYLNWHAEILSPEEGVSLIIPEGFAHGFQTLSDDVHLIYCHTAAYTPAAEAGLNVRDPLLGIEWPLNIGEISNRDLAHPFIGENFEGV